MNALRLVAVAEVNTRALGGNTAKFQLMLFPSSMLASSAMIVQPPEASESLTRTLRTIWTAPVASTKPQRVPPALRRLMGAPASFPRRCDRARPHGERRSSGPQRPPESWGSSSRWRHRPDGAHRAARGWRPRTP